MEINLVSTLSICGVAEEMKLNKDHEHKVKF